MPEPTPVTNPFGILNEHRKEVTIAVAQAKVKDLENAARERVELQKLFSYPEWATFKATVERQRDHALSAIETASELKDVYDARAALRSFNWILRLPETTKPPVKGP